LFFAHFYNIFDSINGCIIRLIISKYGRRTVYTYDDGGTWTPQAYTFAF